MKKYKYGKLPVNARISIDYTGKEPKIKFGYPGKQNPVKTNVGLTAMFLILLTLIIFTIFLNNMEKIFKVDPPTSCEITQHKDGEYIKNITLICNDPAFIHKNIQLEGRVFQNNYLHFIYSSFRSDDLIIDKTIPLKTKILGLVLMNTTFLLLMIILPIILAHPLTSLLVKWNWYKAKIPDINKAIGGRGYKASFKTVPKEKYIEIPLFKNVFLDYHATKQFSKYLIKMEIKEHPFLKYMGKKKNKRTFKKNVDLWYARFYFKAIPKTGKLEVKFK